VGVPNDTELVAATSTAANPNVPASALTFGQGKATVLQRVVAIETFQILAAGVLVATRTNTKDSDFIADDILDWAATHFDLAFDDLRPDRARMSQIDFRFDRSIPELFPQFRRVGERISEGVAAFFEFQPPFELTGLQFYFDKHKFPTFAPPALRIDRRDGVPFDQNVYWSEAPLRTDDHLAVLAEFERACLSGLK
jgi:hypothetical protein